jgi:hypothetical protein
MYAQRSSDRYGTYTLLMNVVFLYMETLNHANISWLSELKPSGLKYNSGLNLQRLAL